MTCQDTTSHISFVISAVFNHYVGHLQLTSAFNNVSRQFLSILLSAVFLYIPIWYIYLYY